MGLTGVHDFDGERARAAMQALPGEDGPGLRFVSSVLGDELEAALAQGLRGGDGDEWLRMGAVKVMMDGALSQATAWMWAPYDGLPDQLGMALISPEELFALGTRARSGGFAMAVHAIGDRANSEVLDVFARLRAAEAAEAGAASARRAAQRRARPPSTPLACATASSTCSSCGPTTTSAWRSWAWSPPCSPCTRPAT